VGYDTFFELSIFTVERHEVFEIQFQELDTAEWSSLGLNPENDSNLDYILKDGEVQLRWYDHYEDMIEFSKKHKNIMFRLTGFGDNNGDIWRSYFHDGIAWNWELEYDLPQIDDMPYMAKTISEKLGVIPKENQNASVHQPRELETGHDPECITTSTTDVC